MEEKGKEKNVNIIFILLLHYNIFFTLYRFIFFFKISFARDGQVMYYAVFLVLKFTDIPPGAPSVSFQQCMEQLKIQISKVMFEKCKF